MEGTVIDAKYEVVRKIGSGGMGAVYEARDLRTGRRVAVKMILPEVCSASDADIVRRFHREARAGGSIDSQHIAQVLDTGVDAATNSPYLIMELLSGEDLHQLTKRSELLPVELVLRIAAQVCLGLERAHERGIIHRDIKPANIYLARLDGGQVVVKILDFGIAKMDADPGVAGEGRDLTRSGATLGSRFYMSPEQALGWRDLDRRSDIWSLGVVMYEALCGTTPQGQQPSEASVLGLCSEPAPPLGNRRPGLSGEVAAIVHKALSLEPSQRFQDARGMHAAIVAQLPGGAIITEKMLAELPRTGPRAASAGPPVMAPLPEVATSPPEDTTARVFVEPHRKVRQRALFNQRVRTGASVLGAGLLLWLATWAYLPRPVASKDNARTVSDRPSATTSTTTPAPSPASDPVPADQTTLDFALAIGAPRAAVVEIDGQRTPHLDGLVHLVGSIGTVHRVHVALDDREASAIVVLSREGPVPAEVDLPPAARAARPTSRIDPSASSTIPAKPLPAEPTSLTIDRNF